MGDLPVSCLRNATNSEWRLLFLPALNRAQAAGWLKKEGFAGQQLHWTIFRCIDAAGDRSADAMTDLGGRNGEAPEFKAVRLLRKKKIL